jgi:hypothetical protein
MSSKSTKSKSKSKSNSRFSKDTSSVKNNCDICKSELHSINQSIAGINNTVFIIIVLVLLAIKFDLYNKFFKVALNDRKICFEF